MSEYKAVNDTIILKKIEKPQSKVISGTSEELVGEGQVISIGNGQEAIDSTVSVGDIACYPTGAAVPFQQDYVMVRGSHILAIKSKD